MKLLLIVFSILFSFSALSESPLTEDEVKKIIDGALERATKKESISINGPEPFEVNENTLVANVITIESGSTIVFHTDKGTTIPPNYLLILAEKLILQGDNHDSEIIVNSRNNPRYANLTIGQHGDSHNSAAATGEYGFDNNGKVGGTGKDGGSGADGKTLFIGNLIIAANELKIVDKEDIKSTSVGIHGYGIDGGNGGNGGKGEAGGTGGKGGASKIDGFKCRSQCRSGGSGGQGGSGGKPGNGADGGDGLNIILFGPQDTFIDIWHQIAHYSLKGGKPGKPGNTGKGGAGGAGGARGDSHQQCDVDCYVGPAGAAGKDVEAIQVKLSWGERGQSNFYYGNVPSI